MWNGSGDLTPSLPWRGRSALVSCPGVPFDESSFTFLLGLLYSGCRLETEGLGPSTTTRMFRDPCATPRKEILPSVFPPPVVSTLDYSPGSSTHRGPSSMVPVDSRRRLSVSSTELLPVSEPWSRGLPYWTSSGQMWCRTCLLSGRAWRGEL